jgi:hemoglobin-like flavoprotein
MTQKQIELVRSTWSLVAIVNPVDVGELFYDRIFEIAPRVRSMFHSPMLLHKRSEF